MLVRSIKAPRKSSMLLNISLRQIGLFLPFHTMPLSKSIMVALSMFAWKSLRVVLTRVAVL